MTGGAWMLACAATLVGCTRYVTTVPADTRGSTDVVRDLRSMDSRGPERGPSPVFDAVRPPDQLTATTLTSGLYSYYKLEETSGLAVDSTTLGKHLTYVSPTNVTRGIPGRFGKGVRVAQNGDGFGMYRMEGDYKAANWTGFSVVAWVRNQQRGTVANIRDCGFAGYVWDDGLSNNTFTTTAGESGTCSAGTVGIKDGAWHLVAWTYDGGFVRMHVDAKQVGACPWTGMLTGSTYKHLFVAGTWGSIDTPLVGELDEVGIWSRALSPAELAWLHANELTP